MTEYCVKLTALDALKLGFKAKLLLHCCASLTPQGEALALEELARAGVEFLSEKS